MPRKFSIRYLLLFTLLLKGFGSFAQTTVLQVYTDYNTFWTSSTTSINPTVPNNTHNLLGFRVGTQVYSTGVNDAKLTANGITFTPQIFESLPVISVGSGGIIGVGANYTVTVVNNPIHYLTDGTNGLDLSTGMFNWSGTNRYTINTFNPAAIGDGIPDILIPQMGDPSAGSTDIFRFENGSNVLVGNQVSVNFGSVSTVANQNWKFYTRASPPVVGAAGAGNRAMRFIAYDFADLGITLANYTNVTSFVHQLSGSSDQCFVAYNKTSFTILPITLLNFDAIPVNKEVQLGWSTASEQNNNFFTIERSTDASHFSEIGKLDSKAMYGNSQVVLDYAFTDSQPADGHSYYRLKQTDFNGKYSYSAIRAVNFSDGSADFRIYPNPAGELLSIALALPVDGAANEEIEMSVTNSLGETVYESILIDQQSVIDVRDLNSGLYFVRIASGAKSSVKKLVIRK